MIPISAVDIGPEEIDSVVAVLKSGRLAQGPVVEALEHDFALRHGVSHAIAVNNGTTALVGALRALELSPGDEVITSAFSFVATLNAILDAGLTARFADIGHDFCMDPASVEALIGPRTRAILPVHLYGLPADMKRLSALSEQHDLAIIEDAAQAHGAAIEQRSVGSYGIGCFSFYATKNMTCGEGGIITTNDAAIADRLRLLRNQGMRHRYEYETTGYNYRLTEFQGAMLRPQLARLDHISTQRQENAAYFTETLGEVKGLTLPIAPPGRRHVFHQYTIRVTPDARLNRDDLAKELATMGIATGIYYPRVIYDYDCYRSHPQVCRDPAPLATRVATEVLSLPVHQRLERSDLETISSAVREVLR